MNLEQIVKALNDCLPSENRPIHLHEPCFSGKEWEYTKACLDEGMVSSVGSQVDRFERLLEEYTGASHAVAAGDEDQNDSRSRTAADNVEVRRNPNTQNEARVNRTHAKERDRVSTDADGGDENHRNHRKVETSASKAVAAANEDQKDSRSRPAADNVDVHRNPNNQTEARVTKSQNKIQLARTRSTGRDRVSKDADGGDEGQVEDSPGTGVQRPRTLDKRELDVNRWSNSQSMGLICGWSCDDVNLSTLGGEGVVVWRERDKSVECQIFT